MWKSQKSTILGTKSIVQVHVWAMEIVQVELSVSTGAMILDQITLAFVEWG